MSVSGTYRFQYDGAAIIAAYNGSNVMQHRWVHGPGMDEPLVRYDGSGMSNRTWLHADERGSIIAHTDSSGARTQTNTYDAYGNPGASNAGLFQYTGQVWLEDAGVYYYKNRTYHAELGRFMQADPIGHSGGVNLYAYVGGDPVNARDPWGLKRCYTLYHYEVGPPIRDEEGKITGYKAIPKGTTETCFADGYALKKGELYKYSDDLGRGEGNEGGEEQRACNTVYERVESQPFGTRAGGASFAVPASIDFIAITFISSLNIAITPDNFIAAIDAAINLRTAIDSSYVGAPISIVLYDNSDRGIFGSSRKIFQSPDLRINPTIIDTRDYRENSRLRLSITQSSDNGNMHGNVHFYEGRGQC